MEIKGFRWISVSPQVLNVSCPNTTEGKTFEEPEALAELLKAVKRQRKEQKPILVKLMATPDTEAFGIGYNRLKMGLVA